MACLFLIPAKYHEELLRQRIAGLSLAERLVQQGRRAGIKYVSLIASSEDLPDSDVINMAVVEDYQKLQGLGLDRCIVCRPGILPDIRCLEWLKEVEVKDEELLEFKDALFVFSPSRDGFELQKAFEKDGYYRLLDFLHTFLTRRPMVCERGQILDATGKERIPRVEKLLFKSLIKDTEGFMSRFVERPISLAISRRLVDTAITPNQITLISVLIGLLGAFFISLGRGFWQIAGSILFLVHSIVDGCDGEIARIKFMESWLGGILDFWGDNVVHAAVFSAIGLEWWRRTGSIIPLSLSVVAVVGTFLSALLIYLSTMKQKGTSGPLYTSVSKSEKKTRIVKIADFLSRRDFIYLVVILAFYQHLDWFLIAAAAGTMLFLSMLVWIRVRD